MGLLAAEEVSESILNLSFALFPLLSLFLSDGEVVQV